MMTKLTARLAAALLPLVLPLAAVAQTGGASTMAGYPPSNAAYRPAVTGSAVSILAANAPAVVTFNLNGVGTARFNVSGTYTGLTATFQCASTRPASPTWRNLSVIPVGGGGGKIINITANGTYLANVAGCATVQLNVTALSTGTVVVDAGAGEGVTIVDAAHERRPTYSATIAALAPAASATDFLTLCGNATTTVRLTRVQLNGSSTAASSALVVALARSVADTAGTSTTLTAVPHDANDPAASSAVKAYTANPTTGTLIGNVRAALLTTNTLAAPAFGNDQGLVFTFGDRWNEEVVLRGTAQCFALNGNGASFTAGTSLIASVEWTEE
jgi:hypothetical protein